MKKIIIVMILMILFFCFVCNGYAQEHALKKNTELPPSLELDAFSRFSQTEKPERNALAYMQAPVDGFRRLRQQYLFSHEGETNEFLAGLTYELFEGFSFGAMGGFEFQDATRFRFALSMLYERHMMLAEALYEKGEGTGNNWHKLTAGFRPFTTLHVPGLLLGVREQTGIGAGPFVEWNIGNFVPYAMYGMSRTADDKVSVVPDKTIGSFVLGLRYHIIF